MILISEHLNIKNLSEDEVEELMKEYEATYDLPNITFTPPKKDILDPFMKERLQMIFNYMVKWNRDWWILIVGPEGSGKTTLTAAMLYYWTQLVQQNFFELLKTNVVFDDDEMLRMVSKMNLNSRYEFIWIDEGANVFQNRDSASEARKAFVKYGNAVRHYQRFFAICAVEMKQLDTILLNHRAKSMIRIQEPGIYHYFSEKQYQRLLKYNETKRDKYFNWRSVEPEHVGSFGHTQEFADLADRLKNNYMKRLQIEANRIRIKSLRRRLGLWQESKDQHNKRKHRAW